MVRSGSSDLICAATSPPCGIRLLAMTLLVMLLEACTHRAGPQPALPDLVRNQIQKIGVAVSTTAKNDELHFSSTGVLSNARRGAAEGAAIGGGVGAMTGPAALFFAPVGALAGSMGGLIYGAVKSEDWNAAEPALRAALAEAAVEEVLPEQLIAFAGAHGYDTARVPATPDPALAAIRDTLLEVRDLEVSLLPVGSKVNPMRWLVLGARTRLVRTVDGTVLDDRIVSDPLGPALDLGEWTANRAARFREEVERAGPRLAEQIVTGLFMA